MIFVAVSFRILAALPLNLTLVTPNKFEPSIVTLVRTSPLAGMKLVILGVWADIELPGR